MALELQENELIPKGFIKRLFFSEPSCNPVYEKVKAAWARVDKWGWYVPRRIEGWPGHVVRKTKLPYFIDSDRRKNILFKLACKSMCLCILGLEALLLLTSSGQEKKDGRKKDARERKKSGEMSEIYSRYVNFARSFLLFRDITAAYPGHITSLFFAWHFYSHMNMFSERNLPPVVSVSTFPFFHFHG